MKINLRTLELDSLFQDFWLEQRTTVLLFDRASNSYPLLLLLFIIIIILFFFLFGV